MGSLSLDQIWSYNKAISFVVPVLATDALLRKQPMILEYHAMRLLNLFKSRRRSFFLSFYRYFFFVLFFLSYFFFFFFFSIPFFFFLFFFYNALYFLLIIKCLS